MFVTSRRLKLAIKKFAITEAMSTVENAKIPREVRIPVPWGHIAGKEWGNKDGEPWIALHGWLDNCGSFDTLLPLFPEDKRVVAVDMPGHGHSSHYPEGFMYHYLDGLQWIRRIAQHFSWEKFNLMGHSMGGGMSFVYAVTHPECVEKLVMIDAVKPISRDVDTLVSRTRSSVDDLMSIEAKQSTGKHNIYSYESAISRLLEGSNFIHGQESITRDSAEILLKRGLKRATDDEQGDAWIFTRDLKHRAASLYGYPQVVMKELAGHVKCPHLIVRANSGRLYEKSENVAEVLSIYQDTNPGFRMAEVDGNHHVHLNQPEKVWPAIDEFMAEISTR